MGDAGLSMTLSTLNRRCKILVQLMLEKNEYYLIMLPNQSSSAYIQVQLHKAFENIPPIFFEQPVINIIDYGSGQAIGTMCYVDFLKNKSYTQIINKVTLIQPTENLLKLALPRVSKIYPDAEIITINKHLEDLDDEDIVCDEIIPTLHILYDLDWEFDLGNFAQVISDNLKGYNQFVCVGPCFNDPIADGLVDDFAEFFYINDKEDNYIKTFSEFELDPNEPWSAHIRCFSVGK